MFKLGFEHSSMEGVFIYQFRFCGITKVHKAAILTLMSLVVLGIYQCCYISMIQKVLFKIIRTVKSLLTNLASILFLHNAMIVMIMEYIKTIKKFTTPFASVLIPVRRQMPFQQTFRRKCLGTNIAGEGLFPRMGHCMLP